MLIEWEMGELLGKHLTNWRRCIEGSLWRIFPAVLGTLYGTLSKGLEILQSLICVRSFPLQHNQFLRYLVSRIVHPDISKPITEIKIILTKEVRKV